ncbi:hypothetical protein H6G33_10070 [Calothrix sp. FACHB-1219]|uniref:hypothetical protein n=1 Tax=unclassified Calothrix TaxID=2619626 RepID=UPI001682CD65|nr:MULTISPECIES: hypothetical protein [unclassified Calothrix]MBD2201693.1 hypothetical protein [Calothrix sp. FACHB-168]MBD2217379.1 hypothetical protein [Calothrix sp. FACHB-1219]
MRNYRFYERRNKLIGIGLVIVCFVGGSAYLNSRAPEISESASNNAKRLVSSISTEENKWSVVSCSGRDSDGDDYVRCTIKSSNGEIKALECPYYPWGNQECVLPKINNY